jgi:uncharacterized protein involved in type VI secretion and phage assembly
MAQNITFSLDKEWFNVLKLTGTEGISKPYQFIIDILTSNFDPNDYILKKACINLESRSISGIITEGKQVLLNMQGQTRTSFTLEPRLTLAKLSQNVRVIINQTVPEIINDILNKVGYQKLQIKWHLSSDYQLKPYRMQVPGETDLQFMHRLLANARIFYWMDSDIIHLSDNNDFSPYLELTYDPYKLSRQYSFLTNIVIAESTVPNLQPGFSLTFKNEDYLIHNLTHNFAQNIKSQGHNVVYHNQAEMKPRGIPINIEKPKPPQFPAVFQAHIESHGNYANLDAEGKYYLRQRFDLAKAMSPPLAKLTPYPGWHMPLKNSAEVLVGSINGDPDEPIILGTIPNIEQLSPVTSMTEQHNKITTASNNQLIMDDTINKQKIQLATHEQNNLLELNADQNQPHVDLVSKKGAINWQAKQTLQIHSKKNTEENIGNDRVQIATQNHQTKTQHQDIDYQAGANQQLNSYNNLRLQAWKNIELTSNNSLNIQSQNQIYLTTKGQRTNFNIQDGNLFLQSANDINIIGNGNGDIEFTQNNAGFKITKDGTVEIYGNNINGLTDDKLTLKGKINYLDNTPKIAPPAKIPELITPKAITETEKAYPAVKFDLTKLPPLELPYPAGTDIVLATLTPAGSITLKKIGSYNPVIFSPTEYTLTAKSTCSDLFAELNVISYEPLTKTMIIGSEVIGDFITKLDMEYSQNIIKITGSVTPKPIDIVYNDWNIYGEFGFQIAIVMENQNPMLGAPNIDPKQITELAIGTTLAAAILEYASAVLLAL